MLTPKVSAAALIALAIATSAGCSDSPDPFDPTGVDIQGHWTVSVDDDAGPGAPPGTINPCQVNAPVDIIIQSGGGDTAAISAPGGTIQCQLNGVWGSPGPYLLPTFYVSRRGAATYDLYFGVGGPLALTGTLIAANQLRGTEAVGWQGRVGRWTAVR